jgi:hypothetical protein
MILSKYFDMHHKIPTSLKFEYNYGHSHETTTSTRFPMYTKTMTNSYKTSLNIKQTYLKT